MRGRQLQLNQKSKHTWKGDLVNVRVNQRLFGSLDRNDFEAYFCGIAILVMVASKLCTLM